MHNVSEGNAKFDYTTTNLSPVHNVSEGNAGESLCALGSYIHEGCAAHLNQETKKQPKSKQSNHLRSKGAKEHGNKIKEEQQVEIEGIEATA